MKKLTSCGFLIQSKDKFLLCHPSSLRVGKLAGDKGWGLPKGKVDINDKMYIDCALRETKEETDIDLRFHMDNDGVRIFYDSIYETKYITTFEGEKVIKNVIIYYAYDARGILQNLKLSCPSLVPNTNIPEMDDFRWVSLEEAAQMCFASMRELFENLEAYVPFATSIKC